MCRFNNKKITFFTPTMGKTGSEVVLLNLLKNINPEFQLTLITKFKIETPGLPPNIKLDYLYQSSSGRIWNRVLNRLMRRVKLTKYRNSIWYINTIVLPEVINYAKQNNVKLILHVHELEQMFEPLSSEQIQNIICYPDLIIANSKTTENVLNKLGRKENIEVCYPALDTNIFYKNSKMRRKYRDKLNLKPEQFVWMMCGTLDENKNPILFINIANELAKLNSDIIFIWLGNSLNKDLEKVCNQKIKFLGLSDKVKWIFGAHNEYYNYFNCADGFVLTSLRESFSLVTIEALLLELPIVTQDSGGVNEILKHDIGKIIRQRNNAKAMAVEMLKFMNGAYKVDKDLQIQRAHEFDISIWAKKWNEILLNYFKSI